MTARVLVGNNRIGVEDVLTVATGSALVDLDVAVLDHLKEAHNKSAGKGKKPEEGAEEKQAAGGEALQPVQSRAVVFLRLVSLMQGRARVNPAVMELLAQLLNKQCTPVITQRDTDAASLADLTAVITGFGRVVLGGATVPTAEALKKLGLQAVALKAEEKEVLQGSLTVSTAMVVLAVLAAGPLLDTADCVSALTLEALEAATDALTLDANNCRPHSGQVLVANNLRLLLDESKVAPVDGKRKEGAPDDVSLRLVPQYHGPLRDVYNVALKVARTEVNSAEEVVPTKGKLQVNAFHIQPLCTTSVNLQVALLALARASRDRLGQILQHSTVNAAKEQKLAASADAAIESIADKARASVEKCAQLSDIAGVWSAVVSTRRVLSLEAGAALFILDTKDSVALEAAKKKIADKEAAAKAREEQQRAEEEEKRKAAEAAGKTYELQAKKIKKNEEPKAAPRGLVFGKGTALIKKFLNERCGGEATPVALAERLYAVLDPYSRELLAQLADCLTARNQMSEPKVPKGTRDLMPKQVTIREHAFQAITSVFRRHGGVGIDTPVFELKETLTGKYGEDSKLIYDLADQGGEMLSLRYDLTVPFARFLAVHKITNIKRYHIAKVYRRDNPAMNRGRFREFYQCDYDIAGEYAPMIPDAEVLKVLTEILSDLKIGHFRVKLSHRKLLDAMMEVCGVPAVKFRTICSAIDKLDKEPWAAVKEEMVREKGLEEKVADRIGTYVTKAGTPLDMLKLMQADKAIMGHAGGKQAVEELQTLFEYLQAMDCLEHISFDMSLARGLDYYTGVIYEAILIPEPGSSISVGSIAAGGRYDSLVGMFSRKPVPAVGVSVGFERVCAILEKLAEEKGMRESETEVLVASTKGMLTERMALCAELWKHNIRAEFFYHPSPPAKRQMDHAASQGIPYIVFLDAGQLAEQGTVNVKALAAREEVAVKRGDVAVHLAKVLGRLPAKLAQESKVEQ